MNIRESITSHNHSYSRKDISVQDSNREYNRLSDCGLDHTRCRGSKSTDGVWLSTSESQIPDESANTTTVGTLDVHKNIRNPAHYHQFDKIVTSFPTSGVFQAGLREYCPDDADPTTPHIACRAASSSRYTNSTPMTSLYYGSSNGDAGWWGGITGSVSCRRTGGIYHTHSMTGHSCRGSSAVSYAYTNVGDCAAGHTFCVETGGYGTNYILIAIYQYSANTDSEKG